MHSGGLGGAGPLGGGTVMDPVSLQLEKLLSNLLDGRATDEDGDELAKLLNEHPQLMAKFAEELSIHSLLQWQGEDVTGDLIACDLASADEPSAPAAVETIAIRPAGVGRRSWRLAAAAVAAVCVGAAWWSFTHFLSANAAVAQIAE